MKTELDENGMITIRPESAVEAYALRQWADKGEIEVLDVASDKVINIHYSRLCIDSSWPPEIKP